MIAWHIIPYHCDGVEGVKDGEEEDMILSEASSRGSAPHAPANLVRWRGPARNNAIRRPASSHNTMNTRSLTIQQ